MWVHYGTTDWYLYNADAEHWIGLLRTIRYGAVDCDRILPADNFVFLF